MNAPVRIQGAGRVALGYDAADPGNLSFAQGAGLTFLNADGSAATAAVAGQVLAINGQGYTLVRTMADLDGIDGVAAVTGGTLTDQSAAGGLSGRYALAGSLDASGRTYANALVGTGSSLTTATQFTGNFEGLGNTLTGPDHRQAIVQLCGLLRRPVRRRGVGRHRTQSRIDWR